MTKLFHRLSTRIVLEILLAVTVSAAIFAGANAALTRFFQQYATEPAVFRRLSDRHFQDCSALRMRITWSAPTASPSPSGMTGITTSP